MTLASGAVAQTAPPAIVPPRVAAPPSPAELISKFRLQHGEGRVSIDAALNKIAHAQAAAMATKAVLDHDVLGSFSTRVAPANAGRAAENIAYGYDDFPRTLTQWIESSGHRKNLLLHDATKVGVASVKSPANQRTYWAMVIAGGYENPKAREPKLREPKAVVAAKPSKPKSSGACRMSVLGLCLY